MKTLIISDLHGRNPLPFIADVREEGIERVVALGDYDEPSILESLLDLDMEKIILIGNHDDYFAKGKKVYSPSLRISPSEYVDLWAQALREKKFVLESGKIGKKRAGRKRGMKVVERLEGRKVAYVHGSLGRFDSEETPLDHLLWGRLKYHDERKKNNFKVMQRFGYWLLFRGHDHFSEIWSVPYKFPEYRENVKVEQEGEGKAELREDKRYIMNIGCFGSGDYAILDNNNGESTVEFKKT